jgi:multisubunit Na+/H+ antiporter MnhF subunit
VIAFATALALGAGALAALGRLVAGPTLHDRAMAAQACLLCITVWIAALGALAGRAAWIDIALALAIGDIVVAIATFKAFRVRSLQTALARPGGAKETAQ